MKWPEMLDSLNFLPVSFLAWDQTVLGHSPLSSRLTSQQKLTAAVFLKWMYMARGEDVFHVSGIFCTDRHVFIKLWCSRVFKRRTFRTVRRVSTTVRRYKFSAKKILEMQQRLVFHLSVRVCRFYQESMHISKSSTVLLYKTCNVTDEQVVLKLPDMCPRAGATFLPFDVTTKSGIALLYNEETNNTYDVCLKLTKEVLTIQKLDVVCTSGSESQVNGGAEHNVPVVISKIFKDQVADQTGKLFVGDAVLQVNGINVEPCTHEEVVSIFVINCCKNPTRCSIYPSRFNSSLKFIIKMAVAINIEQHINNLSCHLGSPGLSTDHSRVSSPLFDSGLHLNGNGNNTAPSPPLPSANEPKYEKRWLDAVSIPLLMARVSRYKAGTDKLRSNCFEVFALDGANTNILQFCTAAESTDWLQAISTNINDLTQENIVHMGWACESLEGTTAGRTSAFKFLALRGPYFYIFRNPPVQYQPKAPRFDCQGQRTNDVALCAVCLRCDMRCSPISLKITTVQNVPLSSSYFICRPFRQVNHVYSLDRVIYSAKMKEKTRYNQYPVYMLLFYSTILRQLNLGDLSKVKQACFRISLNSFRALHGLAPIHNAELLRPFEIPRQGSASSKVKISAADWGQAETTYNLYEVLFKVHKLWMAEDCWLQARLYLGLEHSPEQQDNESLCFSILVGHGQSHTFRVELATDLAIWEKSFQRAVFLEVQRIRSKSYMCSSHGNVLCFTIDFGSGFTCSEGTSKTVLWRYKFSQLKGSSDDGKTRVKLLFKNAESKQIEMKAMLEAVLQEIELWLSLVIFTRQASLSLSYLHIGQKWQTLPPAMQISFIRKQEHRLKCHQETVSDNTAIKKVSHFALYSQGTGQYNSVSCEIKSVVTETVEELCAVGGEHEGYKFSTSIRELLISSHQESLQIVHEAFLHSRRGQSTPLSSMRVFTFLRQTEPETLEISRAAEVFQTTLQVLKNRARQRHKRDVTASELLLREHVELIAELSQCLPASHPSICQHSHLNEYRTITGLCNNRWPREVSKKILRSSSKGKDDVYSQLLVEWGQYIDHDITFTPQSSGSTAFWTGVDCLTTCEHMHPCFPIETGDIISGAQGCMPFYRSLPACFVYSGSDIEQALQRQQLNAITSFMDASVVYGHNPKIGSFLRDLSGLNGKLAINEQFTDPKGRPYLPFVATLPSACLQDPQGQRVECFSAGDSRVNEGLPLSALHILWLREHNRIAEALKHINGHWSPETIYQETRKIIGALHQTQRWDKATKTYTDVERPYIVGTYNKYMGGVDLLFIEKCKFTVKSQHWYMYIFWHNITLAVVAWLLYKRHEKDLGTAISFWWTQHSKVQTIPLPRNHVHKDLTEHFPMKCTTLLSIPAVYQHGNYAYSLFFKSYTALLAMSSVADLATFFFKVPTNKLRNFLGRP
ncbi:Gamma-2-syntrophin [Collichthys lucidus]|uniref:Gamma-2-syntrophin n=1 Tax=Collichthys lucidus TaxID=240159 RepID=A0A4U5VF72_COLLU|nr:Gamma-2-syntrophin [Collichthys lucidus]